MSVQIRLARKGKTHKPFYHVVVTDKRNARDGKFIEKVGYYDPSNDPSLIELKEDRIRYWYGKGAVLSGTIEKLCKAKKMGPFERDHTHVVKA